jgi:uncharacterized protein (DUF983 family)
VALGGLCPRCASKTLFKGLVRFAPRCPVCGFDFASCDVGDGPAAFLILIVGALITALAIALELAVEPPFWVHVLLWVPLSLIAVVGLLRLGKGAMIALQFRHQAGEGRIARGE